MSSVLNGVPLSGLRIIEMASYVAGPSCGMNLAQLGAEVIRVDPIGGAADLNRMPRGPDGRSLYWQGLNRGKRCIELDTTTEEGRELLYRLLALDGPGSGIFVTNRPGVEWLSNKELQAVRSDVITVEIEGVADGSSAVDYTVNAEVGLPFITGPSDLAGPVNHVLPAWDLLAGLEAAIAILVALRAREQTGEPQEVKVALSDVALGALGTLGFLADARLTGRSRPRDGNYVYGTFGVDFPTSDGRRVMVTALTTRNWRDLVGATGNSAVIAELERAHGVDLEDEAARYGHRAVIRAILQPWFSARTLEEVREAFLGTAVLWSPYYDVVELMEAPASLYARSPLVREVTLGGAATVPAIARVLRSEQWGGGEPGVAPRLGADTDEVLRSLLGLSDEAISALRDRSVIGNGRLG